MAPPKICRTEGSSRNRNTAIMDAATGSHSLDADTKAGEKYFRHQLKMLCPKMVENTAKYLPDYDLSTL